MVKVANKVKEVKLHIHELLELLAKVVNFIHYDRAKGEYMVKVEAEIQHYI